MYLTAVQEELADTLGCMIETAALEIFRDVGIDEPDLPAAGIGIRFCDRRLALAQRFHFGPGECDTGLESLADLVIETRLAIVGDDASVAVRFCCHPCLPASPRR